MSSMWDVAGRSVWVNVDAGSSLPGRWFRRDNMERPALRGTHCMALKKNFFMKTGRYDTFTFIFIIKYDVAI